MIANILLILTWFFMLFGIFGLFRLKGIYTRLLSSSKIDSVTVITLFTALMIKSGFTNTTLKLGVVLVFYLLTNPVTNQIVANSALRNGIKPDRFILESSRKEGDKDA
ncbi:monovalent cation/H(+) antiporter subunit G [Fusibacter sp. JL216-2]|uniref:monovalent cation/H(+) antiporter subunit G n=1 Tax=Fusibacter sp. JL216-2 TaxID=3071453 RepID=UPI003D34031C